MQDFFNGFERWQYWYAMPYDDKVKHLVAIRSHSGLPMPFVSAGSLGFIIVPITSSQESTKKKHSRP